MNRRTIIIAVLVVAPLTACADRPCVTHPDVRWSRTLDTSSPRTDGPSRWGGLSSPPTIEPSSAPVGFKELFPHIRVDATAKLIEFDGIVPIDAHDAETPHDFLEVIVCTPDTKEHESLVMTRASAAHVHAALLLIGLQPGAPGTWEWDGKNVRAIPPRGEEIDVLFITRDAAGVETVSRPHDWIISVNGAKKFSELSDTRFLFAGSAFRRLGDQEAYSADADGTLIGLCTFGSETIALSRVIHHESSVDEPEWIADAARVPPYGTPVTVRLRPAR